MLSRLRRRHRSRGQALVEFALVLPLFLLVLIGVIVLGIVVFYNQQLTNAAREAARFAAVHSGSAQCPVVANLDPVGSGLTSIDPLTGHSATYAAPPSYVRCDTPPNWPQMTAFARSKVFGLNASTVHISACWSGYRQNAPDPLRYDAPPPGNYPVQGQINSAWAQCAIDGHDPTTDVNSIRCQAGLPTVDTSSDMSEGQGRIMANRVTAYACFIWQPPAAGFLLIPNTITFRAVISEPIQRQQ